MEKYEFFLEHKGRSMSSQDDQTAFDEVTSNSIDKAISKFSSRNKFKLISYDELDDGSYRVFVDKKAFLKKPVEHIFHIRKTTL